MKRTKMTAASLSVMAMTLGMCLATTTTAMPQQDPKPATQADLPSPQKLMDRHIEAIGGANALKKTKSRKITGSIEVVGMFEGDLTIYAAAPDKFLLELDLGQMGSQQQGYDGKVAWMADSMQGGRLAQGAQLEQTRVNSQFYAALDYAKIYPTSKTVEKTEFAGKTCYKVYQKSKGGFESHSYYDVESGLIAGTEFTQDGMTNTMINVEYKKIDGVLISTDNMLHQAGMEISLRFTEIEHNNVEKSVFDLPDDIKALVKDAQPDV